MTEKVTEMEVAVKSLPVCDVIPTPDNPREVDEKSAGFLDLVESIKGLGVQVPVMVRPHPQQDGKFDLRAGERRLRASVKAGLTAIPALVHYGMTDKEAFEVTFAENYGREDLSPLEQGNAVARLLEKYGGDTRAVADKMGKSEQWVRLRANLHANLIPEWRKEWASHHHDWTAAHLAMIARFPKNVQKELLRRNYYNCGTPKDLEKRLANDVRLLKGAPWDLEDARLCPKEGSCAGCTDRSDVLGQAGLWDEDAEPEKLTKSARCLDSGCWSRKAEAHTKAEWLRLKKEHAGAIALSQEYVSSYNDAVLIKRHGKILEEEEVTAAKEGQAGAVPALIVKGPRTGEVRWVKPKKDKRAPAGVRGRNSGPTPLKDRRAALQVRRDALALRHLQQKLEASVEHRDARAAMTWENYPDTGGKAEIPALWTLAALACAYGIERGQVKVSGYLDDKGRLKLCRDLAAFKAEVNVRSELWARLVPVLVREIEGNINARPCQWPLAEYIAGLVKLDLKAMRAAADAAIPEPKSWANLNADGTPKTTGAGSQGPAAGEKKTGQKKRGVKSKGVRATKKHLIPGPRPLDSGDAEGGDE